jgi:predicted ATPase
MKRSYGIEAGFVGRRDQLAALGALAEQVRSESAATVLIEGPAGVGKTELATRFASELTDFAQYPIAAARTEFGLPFSVLTQLLAVLPIRHDDGILSQGGIGRAVSSAVGAALVQELEQLQRKQPILLILDNMQWADPESVEALRFMLRRLHAERVLAVLAGWEQPGGWDASGNGQVWPAQTHHVHLPGLDVAEVTELAKVNRRSISTWAARKLVEQTDGNPLYVKSMLADPDLADRYLFGRAKVPSTLASAIDRSIAITYDQEKCLLTALAVIGEPVTDRMLAQLTGLPAAELTAPLEAAGLIEWRHEPTGDTLAFSSALYRDAVYTNADALTRRRLHAAVAATVHGPDRWRHLVAAEDGDPSLVPQLEAAAHDEAEHDNLISAAE